MSNLNRKRSAVWYHFSIKSSTIAKCFYCGNEYSYSSGSTKNLNRHLKFKHVTVPLTRPSKRNENSPLENEENIDYPSNMPASTSTSVSTASLGTMSETVTPSLLNLPRQNAITQYISKPISLSKSKAIDLQITKFIIKHFHPFSLVEETEFRNLIKMIAPNYIVPSRKPYQTAYLYKCTKIF